MCETNFADREYTTTKSYAAELRHERDTFRELTGTRKTLLLVMVTTHGSRRNACYDELIADQVMMDDLFR